MDPFCRRYNVVSVRTDITDITSWSGLVD